ncbi:MAG: HAD family hydrolase [Ruminiclostridium sp.]|nr:HAD family hydrolase [Ruminiclostridium sp.]
MREITVMFDLDGTLLPMDNERFTKAYFKLLTRKLEPLGFDAGELTDAVWAGTGAMVRNNGKRTNEEVFRERFTGLIGERAEKAWPVFDEFYRNEFNELKKVCGVNSKAAETVAMLRREGFGLVLASNPIFPMTAQEARVRWAGLSPEDFSYITSYENSSFCKPNPEYFRDTARKAGCRPLECVMVGNDVNEDTPAMKSGMRVFLLTDCLINKEGFDISYYNNGNYDELAAFISSIKKEREA